MLNSLRGRLTLVIIGLAIVPLIVVGVISTTRSLNTERDQAEKAQAQTALRVAQEVEALITTRPAELRLLTDVRGLSDYSLDEQKLILNELLLYNPYLDEMLLVDARGQVVIHLSELRLTDTASTTDYSGQEAFTFTIQNRETYYGPVFFDEVSGEPFMMQGVPVINVRADEVAYVLITRFQFKAVWDVIAAERLGAGEDIYLVSAGAETAAGSGAAVERVIAHRDPSVVLRGTTFDTRNLGTTGKGLNGDDVVLGIQRFQLGEQTFSIVSEITTDEAYKNAYESMLTFVLSVLVIILVSFAIGYFSLTQITAPLRTLTAAAQKLGAGDLGSRVKVGGKTELGVLGGAFNAMAEQLSNVLGTLENRVRARTQDLFRTLEVGQLATRVYNREDLLARVTDYIQQQFDLYYTQVYLIDDAQRYAVLRAGTGEVGEQLLDRRHKLELRETSIVARAAQTRRPVLVTDTDTSDVHKPNPLLPETRSEVAIPLVFGDQVLGVLDMQSRRVGQFNEENLPVFEAMANQLATALNSAQSFSEAQKAVERADAINRRLTQEQWESYLGRVGTGERVSYQYDLQSVQPLDGDDGIPHSGNGGTGPQVMRPVMVRNQAIGTIALTEEGMRVWSDDDLGLIDAVADRVAQTLEQFRAFDETYKRAVEMQTVAEVGAEASATLDPDQLLATVSDLVKERFSLYHAHVYLLDDDGERLSLVAGAGEVGRQMAVQGRKIPLNHQHSLVARAARSRQGVIVNDVIEADDFLPNPLLPDTRSEMAIPMVVGDALIGVLDVQSEYIGRFGEDDVQIMSTLAAQVAVAVENARLFTESAQRLAIIENADSFTALVDLDGRVFYMNAAGVKMSGFDSLEDVRGTNIGDSYTPEMMDRFQTEILPQVLEEGSWRGENVLPRRDGTLIPVDQSIFVIRDQDGQPQFLATILTDITERKASEEAIRKRAVEMQAVAEVGAEAAATLDPDELLQTVTDLTKERFDLYHAHVYLIDDARQNLVLAAGAGETGRSMVATGHMIALNSPRSLVAQAARSGEVVTVNNVREAPDFLPNPRLPLTRSEMAVPMIVGERVIGVLDVQASEVDHFTDADVQVQSTLAAQVAVAVQNARLFAESAQRLAIIENADDFTALVDLDGRVLYMNAAGMKMIGVDNPEDVRGFNIGTMYSPEMMDRFQAEILPQVLEEGSWRGEHALPRQDGTVIPVDQSIFVIRDQDDQPQFLATILTDITERKAAEELIRKRAVEMQAVAEVGAEAAATLDPDELLQTVTDLTKERFDLYHAHVYLIDDARQNLVLAAGAGETGRSMVATGHMIALNSPRSLVAQAARSGEVVTVNNVREAPDFLPNPRLPLTRSEMAVPMIVGERVIGVLDVQASEVDHFTDADVQVQSTLAAQVAVAVQNARLFAESAQRLAVIENADMMITLSDLDGRAVYVNPAARKALGYVSLDDVRERRLDESYPPEAMASLEQEIYPVLMRDGLWHGEHVMYRPDGSLAPVDQTIFLIYDNQGEPQFVATIATDITERKAAEELIRKRAVEMQTVAEVSAEAAASLDPTGLLGNVSELTKERFDLYHAHIYLLDDTGDLLVLAAGAGDAGRLMVQAGHSIPVNRQQSLVAQSARTRRPVVANRVVDAPEFLPNPVLPRTKAEMALPMIVGDRFIGVLDVQASEIDRFTDEDTRVMTTLAAQVAVAVQNARLYEEQVHAADQLREVDRLKSEFLASMSHELRTPLNSIIGYAEVLLDGIDGNLTQDMEEDIGAIHGSGKLLLNLINDILDLAKIEAGQMDLVTEDFEFRSLAQDMVNTARVLVMEKHVDLIVDIPDDLPMAHGDALRIRQVLNNILSNAAKFTEEGSIVLSARVDRDDPTMMRVSITDSGIGMTTEQREVIFDRFRQVDQSHTRRAGGTGLGLSITEQLIHMHGGDIWVESEPGVGSTFHFTLPLAKG